MFDLKPLTDAPFPAAAVQLRCIAFDFKEKTDEHLPRERLGEVGERYAWLDVQVDPAHVDEAAAWLEQVGLIDPTMALRFDQEAIFVT